MRQPLALLNANTQPPASTNPPTKHDAASFKPWRVASKADSKQGALHPNTNTVNEMQPISSINHRSITDSWGVLVNGASIAGLGTAEGFEKPNAAYGRMTRRTTRSAAAAAVAAALPAAQQPQQIVQDSLAAYAQGHFSLFGGGDAAGSSGAMFGQSPRVMGSTPTRQMR